MTVAVFGPPSTPFLTALERAGIPAVRLDELGDLTPYDAVVVVAASYPEPVHLDTSGLAAYVRAGGTAYVEFATDDSGFLPANTGLRVAAAERILDQDLQIYDEHASRVLEVVAPDNATELLAYAHVAGTHTAVFGNPERTFPALLAIPHGSGKLLYATTALSHYVQGNYKPRRRWDRLIQLVVATPAPTRSRSTCSAPTSTSTTVRGLTSAAATPRGNKSATCTSPVRRR